jgi:WD40 repeat protein/serine/threonine protein kinase
LVSDSTDDIIEVSGDQDVTPTSPLRGEGVEPGGRIGPYKLLKVLGQGGFGVVYLAEQAYPIKRTVALKVIKLGMDTKQVIARFERERQALAMLDHPHIARVFDAGATDTGRPYFAMEYVKGIPITDYCDRYKLSTRERLRLFIPLCESIQHAHQKGIVHRDIKPSNALVTLDEKKPVPKVIDFGVAKALHQRLTESTLVTQEGQFIGTPEYMSPEQADFTGLDVDTRTDIYSLGVLLYKLLTGFTPFDSEYLLSKGYVEMQRIICQQDPVKPSTKLTTLGDKLEDVARNRGLTADQLRRSVRGDLDWIVMKALEKDRTRRYEAVHSMALDIEHHLNNEPVLARPPSKLYRFQKLVRRNKGLFAAVATVAVVLIVGVVVSTRQAVRATRAEREQSRLRQEAVAAGEKEARLRQQAEARELAMRQLAYASDMSMAQQALAMNDLGRARRLLEGHRPGPGQLDLRGWEWRYLWQECRSDALGELHHYPDSVYAVAYSADGKTLAVTGLMQRFVEIWDVPGRKRIKTLQPEEGNLAVFSPRGGLLATDASKEIRLWRTGTWDLVHKLTLPANAKDLKFSPDGKLLACMNYSNEVIVWEVEEWEVIRRIRDVRPVSYWGAMDFSPDGKALVIGDYTHRLHVVDLADGSTDVNIPEAHSEGITSVAWSPSGSIIASGSAFSGGAIRLWDAATGKPVGKLEWLYSAAGDQTIRIWDVKQRRCLSTFRGSSHEVYGLGLSPDGTRLASACKDGVVAFWDAGSGGEEEQPGIIELGSGRFARPAFAPGGKVLAAPYWGTVSLFDLATFEEIEKIPALGVNDVHIVVYSPDGTLLLSGSENGRIRVWSCAERRVLQELDGHKEPIFGLYFREDGKELLSVDTKGKAIWWDALTWETEESFTVEFAGGGAVSPDGRLLAIGAESALRWLNAKTGESLKTTPGPPHPIVRVAFSDDGSQVAGVSEYGTVSLWDSSSFELVATFSAHMQGAHGVAFSPNGRRLATGGGTDRDAIKLWDLSTNRELMTLSGEGTLFLILAFSPDGRWLAACSWEGKLHLWHASSWTEIEAEEQKPLTGQTD